MKHALSLTVNGADVTVAIDPRAALADVLHEQLALRSVHIGCEEGECGACQVWLDGEVVTACTVLAAQADGSAVTTLEGLEEHPVCRALADALVACHGIQCGYCTPGVLMNLTDFLIRERARSEDALRERLRGNLCRCTGYDAIVAAAVSCSVDQAGRP